MDVLGFAIPTAIVAKYGGKTARSAKYLSETLALTSGGMKNIGENVYEQVIGRMTEQPSGTARSLVQQLLGITKETLEPYEHIYS